MKKTKQQPPAVVLEYQFPNSSALRVRIVRTTDDYGEVTYEYEQSTSLDAMGLPRWSSGEDAVKRGDEKHEVIARRVVDLLGQVLSGKIKGSL